MFINRVICKAQNKLGNFDLKIIFYKFHYKRNRINDTKWKDIILRISRIIRHCFDWGLCKTMYISLLYILHFFTVRATFHGSSRSFSFSCLYLVKKELYYFFTFIYEPRFLSPFNHFSSIIHLSFYPLWFARKQGMRKTIDQKPFFWNNVWKFANKLNTFAWI